MGDRGHQQPKAEDTTADPSPDGASPGAIRNFILWTIALLLLAAWSGSWDTVLVGFLGHHTQLLTRGVTGFSMVSPELPSRPQGRTGRSHSGMGSWR